MRDYSESDTFVVITMVEGAAAIRCGGESTTVSKGHSVLIPASATGIEIDPDKNVRLLEAYIS